MTTLTITRAADGEPGTSTQPLLEVDDLSVEFHLRDQVVRAVNNLSYSVGAGETLAILGESGSGKSVSAQAVMGILDCPPAKVTGGAIRFRGGDLLRMTENARRQVRGQRIAMVFQDALTALNPVFTVGDQIGEMFRVHRGMGRKDSQQAAIQLMERVRIPSARTRVRDYPHEFSGGMRQRVMIAMALALEPELLIADEPTTALDVTVQAQIMRLLADLRRELSMGLVLITHDLAVVADVADRIAVMYAGSRVEEADVRELYARPAHPYTEGLLTSVPRLDRKDATLIPISGSPPDLSRIPSGCPFHPRCVRAQAVCVASEPPLREVAPGRLSACHYAEEVLDAR